VHKLAPQVELNQGSVVNALAFSAEGGLLASGGDNKIISVWNLNSQEKLADLEGHTAAIKDLAFSPDSELLISVSFNNQIKVWETREWSLLYDLEQTSKVIFVKFRSDKKFLTGNTTGELIEWNSLTGEELARFYTPRNQSPSCASSSVLAYDLQSSGSVFGASLSCGYAVAWKPVGEQEIEDHVAFNNNQNDGTVQLYTNAIAFSPDWQYLAFGNFFDYGPYLIGIGNITSGKFKEGIGASVPNISAMTYSPYGELFLAGVGSFIRVWPIYSYGAQKSIIDLTNHTSQITALEFDNEGEVFASGDYRGAIIVWGVPEK
jgi:WD40 repeat protein